MTWNLYLFLVLLWILVGIVISKLVDRFTKNPKKMPLFFHILFGPFLAVMGTFCYLHDLGWRGCGWAAFIAQSSEFLMLTLGFYLATVLWWAVWLMP